MRFATTLLCAALILPISAIGQAKPDAPSATSEAPQRSYKLTFIVRELTEGKLTGTRTYSSLLTDTRESEVIRSGSKVPTTSSTQGEPQYLDVGANFDFRILYPEHGLTVGKDQLPLAIGADISSIAKEGTTPVIRQNRWRSTCLVNLGKSTILFSSEDPALDRTTQVELTVVKLP